MMTSEDAPEYQALPSSRTEALDLGHTHYFTGRDCTNGHVEKRNAKDGQCLECARIKRRKRYAKDPQKEQKISNRWKENNKKHLASYCHQWRKRNKNHCKQYDDNYRKENKTALLESKRKWRINNLDYVRAYQNHRYNSDLSHKLNHRIRAMVYRVKANGFSKSMQYDCDELRERLEVQFRDGMCWNNYGEWEIDHKIPVSRFTEKGIEDPQIINALSNLQPLWKTENRSKNSSLPG